MANGSIPLSSFRSDPALYSFAGRKTMASASLSRAVLISEAGGRCTAPESNASSHGCLCRCLQCCSDLIAARSDGLGSIPFYVSGRARWRVSLCSLPGRFDSGSDRPIPISSLSLQTPPGRPNFPAAHMSGRRFGSAPPGIGGIWRFDSAAALQGTSLPTSPVKNKLDP